MSTSKTRLCLEDDDGTYHKVAMLSSNANGIYVCVPYHNARQGQFICVQVQDRVRLQTAIPKYKYVASSRAKLSLHPPNAEHPDNFLVHFSGDGILSGFDENGRPRGCSLKGPPMPEITTGPTFGLVVWGLHDFDTIRQKDRDVRLIPQERMYPRKNDGSFNAYELEFFLLPNSLRKSKRKLPTFYKKYIFEGVERGFDLDVIELPGHENFLGITCVRRKVGFGESGYSLNSPRLLDWMISASYPPLYPTDDHISLDYIAPDSGSSSEKGSPG